MKINYKTVVALALLSLAAAGCQKENIVEPNSSQIQQTYDVKDVIYFIDGVQYRTSISGKQDWRLFTSQMLLLAREGHRVEFYEEDKYSPESFTKETVTHTTRDQEDAQNWSEAMSNKGYKVTIEFDTKTGLYTCTAIK